ncbi:MULTISPECIES: SMI1/KNR4 family protein [Flavobacterium]|uniref:Knr4/Smi1-like domain-containing protein n=1 Tax=Flavobacterium ginsengisoli TaxID=871694 RepID=A0ABP7FQT2_9FLAO|nr:MULTISPECIES: SMI1/KNR4 family protein [Flavobacterium]MBJ2126093.1 SMI1/KNR4 family protein [Flavobacterium sp. IB48]
MNYIQKIKRLYNLSENENYGFSEDQILNLEKTLNVNLPSKLKEYYLELGNEENLNYSFNRLLKPENEIGFSDDDFLVFYEENQNVAFWGIKKEDLSQDNSPVYGNYDTIEKSDWEIETETIEDFFLLMAVFNGTLGGLQFNGNYLGEIDLQIVKFIEENYTLVPNISRENQKVYTDDFYEVISLSFDQENNCTGAFIGSSDQERFDAVLDNMCIDWSYLSYDDEEYDEEDEE